jgi:hypothetical protein
MSIPEASRSGRYLAGVGGGGSGFFILAVV